jgi:hypothetical protein
VDEKLAVVYDFGLDWGKTPPLNPELMKTLTGKWLIESQPAVERYCRRTSECFYFTGGGPNSHSGGINSFRLTICSFFKELELSS